MSLQALYTADQVAEKLRAYLTEFAPPAAACQAIILLTARQVASRLGVSRRTIGRMIVDNPKFPKPITVRGNRLYWREADINRFLG